MFEISTLFSRNLSSKISLLDEIRAKRILQRQLLSCPIIRCRVGNLYHMEAKAKLTLIHAILNTVAFLLINFH